MKKSRFIIDFDGTIADSIKAYCDTYNHLYKGCKDFIPAKWCEVEQWNLKDQCPLVENPNEIFSNPLFFEFCEFINPNTKEIIERLCEKYDVSICSIGTHENIAYKSLWISKNLPFIKNSLFIINNGCKADKSVIDMKDAIFIDDVTSNLNSSNAKHKFIFGDEYEWNIDWNGKRCFNWTDVEIEIEKIKQ